MSRRPGVAPIHATDPRAASADPRDATPPRTTRTEPP